MLELQAGVGFGGAARQFYNHHRTLVLSVVLSVAGIGTGTAAASAGLQGIGFTDGLLILVGAVLAACVAYWQTRHVALAVVTALAPLPGLLWAAPISGGSQFGAVPVLAYGFAFAAAALFADAYVGQVLNLVPREPPWRAGALALVLTAAWAFAWFHGAWSDAALQAVADMALALLSVFMLLPMASDLLRFDEGFVARANRTHERRARFWERIAQVTIPRWAISFTGIAIIFLALGWYGGEPAMRGSALLKSGSVVALIVAAGLFARGWREGFAVGLIAVVVCLIALWATVVDRNGGPVGVLQITALAVFLALYGARRGLGFRRAGDPPLIAQRRGLEDAGGQAFAGAGALAAIVPGVAFWSGSLAFVVGLAAAGGVAIVFVPAAATALEALMPRRRSVEELYGKRKKI